MLFNDCSPQTRHLALPLKLFPCPWRRLMICYSRLFMDGLWVTSSNLCQSQPLNCSSVSGNLPNASFFAKLIDGWTTTVMSSCAVLCTTGVSMIFFGRQLACKGRSVVSWSSQRPLGGSRPIGRKLEPPTYRSCSQKWWIVAWSHSNNCNFEHSYSLGMVSWYFLVRCQLPNKNPDSGPRKSNYTLYSLGASRRETKVTSH